MSTFAVFLGIALGPGPTAEHWLKADVRYRDVFLGLAVLIPLLIIYGTLDGPAKITAACDEVASELNALRNAEGKLAPGAVLEQVEALERYVAGIELGFVLFHYRISYTFVYSCLTQLIAVGSILLPMLLAQTGTVIRLHPLRVPYKGWPPPTVARRCTTC